MPTLLELVDIEVPPTVQGTSLLPVIQGSENELRDFTVSCGALRNPPLRMTITSKEWACIPVSSGAPKTDDLGRKLEPELYYLPGDQEQSQNIFYERIEVADEMRQKAIEFLLSLGADKQFLQGWM
jgi:hypothetical protein